MLSIHTDKEIVARRSPYGLQFDTIEVWLAEEPFRACIEADRQEEAILLKAANAEIHAHVFDFRYGSGGGWVEFLPEGKSLTGKIRIR